MINYMGKIERIDLDFSIDGRLEALKTIEDILRSGHWSDVPLDYQDEWTMLLLRMLRVSGITVFRHFYTRQEETSEIMRRAYDINMSMNKRSISQTLLDIAGIFFANEYDVSKTEYNSLFFPKLKAFVRYGGISPERLLRLLERDGCDTVFIFSDSHTFAGIAFHALKLAMTKKEFLAEYRKINERIWDAISDAVRSANEKSGNVFPPIDDWHDSK